MNRKVLTAVIVSACILVGCGKTVEEQVEEGIVKAEASFEKSTKQNTEEGNVSLYLPEGFVIDATEEESNFIVTNNEDQYILFINSKEENTSQLNFDLINKDFKDKIIKIEQLTSEDLFGFIAILQHGEERFELVVSIGGIKLSTMTEDKKMDEKLAHMMDIVRSVEIKQ